MGNVYVEYEIGDGTSLLLEVEPVDDGQIRKTSLGGITTIQATRHFGDALEEIQGWVRVLGKKLSELKADEVEVEFGLKAIGEAGVFAVGKVGAEANYIVKLKWNKLQAPD